jgi:integrase
LAPREKGHFAAIGSDALPEFLRALYANEARMGVPTRVAMRLMLLVFVWTSELIDTPWSEIDLKKGEWIIPWKRMKRGKRRINPDKTTITYASRGRPWPCCATCTGIRAAVHTCSRTCATRSSQ